MKAADKCVRALIFCVRTSGVPYALDGTDFSSCTGKTLGIVGDVGSTCYGSMQGRS